MVAKLVFVACATLALIQSVVGQFGYGTSIVGNSAVENNVIIGNNVQGSYLSPSLNLGGGNFFGSTGLNYAAGNLNLGGVGLVQGGLGVVNSGLGLADLNVVSSGPLIVTSISPIGPTGLAVASENVIEGTLYVSGTLPYLSAVAFEGALPTAGSGVATCGCGTGAVGIIG